MGKAIFHSSIEGGQHGPKGLDGFLAFAEQSGAAGAQPTCYMLEDGKGGFKSAAEVKGAFEKYGLKFNLIADTEKELVQLFGVWQEKTMMGKRYMGTVRTTFLTDEQGVITHVLAGREVDTKNHAVQILGSK